MNNNIKAFNELFNESPLRNMGDISITNIFNNPVVERMRVEEVVSAAGWSGDKFVVIKTKVGVIVLVNDFHHGVTCVTDDIGARCASWKRAGLEKNSVIDTDAKMNHILAIVDSYKS